MKITKTQLKNIIKEELAEASKIERDAADYMAKRKKAMDRYGKADPGGRFRHKDGRIRGEYMPSPYGPLNVPKSPGSEETKNKILKDLRGSFSKITELPGFEELLSRKVDAHPRSPELTLDREWVARFYLELINELLLSLKGLS